MTNAHNLFSLKIVSDSSFLCSFTHSKVFTFMIITLLLTINSARTEFISQPPPIRNAMRLPIISKGGEVMVPWGLSPCSSPAFDIIDGLSSAPPIHQSPCCLAGCPRFRAVGLSPYVGWLLKAVPVFSQPWSPFSKSNLQASIKIWRKIETVPDNII